jgi:hypothetical protein
MKPAVLPENLFIKKGDFFRFFFRVRFRNPDGTPGDYVDLTNYTNMKSEIRPAKGSSTLIAAFTITKSDQTAFRGGVLLTLDDSVTAALENISTGVNVAVMDFQMDNELGERDTYFEAGIDYDLDVTQP